MELDKSKVITALIIIMFLSFTAIASLSVDILELKDYVDYYKNLSEDLEREYNELQDSLPRMVGGAESPFLAIPGYEEVNIDGVYNFAFPIAEEDFRLMTSPYGARVSPLLGIEVKHQGIDVSTVWRAQVISISDGVVVEHWPPPGTPHPNGSYFRGHPIYGGMVIVQHDNGFRSLYAHLSWTRIRTGQRISKGEIIGRVGDTGMSVGQHLHFELYYGDEVINPLLYLSPPNN